MFALILSCDLILVAVVAAILFLSTLSFNHATRFFAAVIFVVALRFRKFVVRDRRPERCWT
jgi:membrane protein implicated in regulation of membrane protease activity